MRRNVADYSEFVAMRWPALVRTAYLLTGDHGHAEDLAQSALTKCLVAWPRLRARVAAHEPVEVYDTSTGRRVTPDFEADQAPSSALTMTFTDDGGVAYALIEKSNKQASIVTCSLPAGGCETSLSGIQTETMKGDTVTYRGVFFANQRHQ